MAEIRRFGIVHGSMEIINEIRNDRDKQLIQQIPIPSVPRRDSW